MSLKFDRAVEVVLEHEGGFVDHPRDPGGATKYGISLRFARERGTMLDIDGDGDVDKTDIQLLTKDKAKMVYREVFWRGVRGDELPPGIDLAVFDFAVNSGISRAVRFLQRALGIQEDGIIGPQTMGRIKAADPATVVRALTIQRLNFLRGLKTWNTFGRGWQRRVDDVEVRALALVGAPMTSMVEVTQTDTAKAAGGMAIAGTLAAAAASAPPVIESLGALSPLVGSVLIVCAFIGFLVWRMRRA